MPGRAEARERAIEGPPSARAARRNKRLRRVRRAAAAMRTESSRRRAGAAGDRRPRRARRRRNASRLDAVARGVLGWRSLLVPRSGARLRQLRAGPGTGREVELDWPAGPVRRRSRRALAAAGLVGAPAAFRAVPASDRRRLDGLRAGHHLLTDDLSPRALVRRMQRSACKASRSSRACPRGSPLRHRQAPSGRAHLRRASLPRRDGRSRAARRELGDRRRFGRGVPLSRHLRAAARQRSAQVVDAHEGGVRQALRSAHARATRPACRSPARAHGLGHCARS